MNAFDISAVKQARIITEARADERAKIAAIADVIAAAAAEPVEDFTAGAWRQLLYMAAHDIRAALTDNGADQ